MYPALNLPANFRKHHSLQSLKGGWWMRELDFVPTWWLHGLYTGTAAPREYSVGNRMHDPNQMQIILYPAPGTSIEAYELVYTRDPGWFSTNNVSTATWKAEATADTDYLDWPDRYMDLFYASARKWLYGQLKDSAGQLGAVAGEYVRLMAACKGDDRRTTRLRTIGDRAMGTPIGQRYVITEDAS
jgi:hypothetical protein